MSGSNKLIDQSQALDSFFESLMRDVEAYAETETEEQSDPNAFKKKGKRIFEDPTPEAIAEVSEAEPVKPVLETPITDNKLFEVLPTVKPVEPEIKEVVEVEPKPVVQTEAIIVEEKTPEPAIDTPLEDKAQSQEPQAEVSTGRPEWGEAEFQAMLFKVGGLTLAVPLVDLNGVVECDLDDVTAMPGHADFYLGLLNHLGKSVPLVDTARFVLPPNKLHLLAGDDPKDRISRAVMIQDCHYALACDEVNEVLTLRPDEVRWRTQRTSRRWLAGTVVEHMCALIDATAFAELLAQRTSIQAFRE